MSPSYSWKATLTTAFYLLKISKHFIDRTAIPKTLTKLLVVWKTLTQISIYISSMHSIWKAQDVVKLSKLIKCKETVVVTDILVINPSNIPLFWIVESCVENITVVEYSWWY